MYPCPYLDKPGRLQSLTPHHLNDWQHSSHTRLHGYAKTSGNAISCMREGIIWSSRYGIHRGLYWPRWTEVCCDKHGRRWFPSTPAGWTQVTQTITQEDVIIEGKEYTKTTVTIVTLEIKRKQIETFYSYEELVSLICSSVDRKDIKKVKDSFDRHLRCRMKTIFDNNILLPAPLYVNRNTLNNFYIVQGNRKQGPLLFKSICYD